MSYRATDSLCIFVRRLLAYAEYQVMEKLEKAGSRRRVPEPKGPQKKAGSDA